MLPASSPLLKDYSHPVRAAFESTGHYHRALAYHLVTTGFEVKLASSGRIIQIAKDKTVTKALAEAGVATTLISAGKFKTEGNPYQPLDADAMAGLLRGELAHVNLIPFNDVAGLPYRRPTPEALTAFVDTLRGGGVSVKVRKRKGSEIDAACGQLRRNAEQEAAENLPSTLPETPSPLE